jgi:hypothetical protein
MGFCSLPVMEEVCVDMNPWILPLYVEVERVGDGEVTIVDHQHVADMNLNLDKVGLKETIIVIINHPMSLMRISILK